MINLEAASDANLVVAIARWHEPAMAEVYRRHGGAVHALARRILRHDPSAEEITQEVFLDLWQRPEKFDSAARHAAFLPVGPYPREVRRHDPVGGGA